MLCPIRWEPGLGQAKSLDTASTAGCRHQDADGAEDGEDGEGHETQAVHHTGRELPLTAHGLTRALAAEAVGDVAHLLQDLG